MKQILIDIYKTKNLFSGLGQFSLSFAKEIIAQCPEDVNLNFLVPAGTNDELSDKANLIESNAKIRYFPSTNLNYNIWHSLHQFPSHLPNKNAKQILTIHDLNFLIEKEGSKRRKYLKRLQQNVDRADFLTTISNYTKGILESNIDLKGKPVRVIYNGIHIDDSKVTAEHDCVNNSKFFFSIGIFSSKKNFQVLLPLMTHFKDYKLIIAGDHKTEYGRELKSQIRKLGLKDKVILTGKISEADKNFFYQNCEAFFFPSLAEGFGMPVVEAMMFGKAVFLSKYSCLPEIGGDAAFYFDNFNADSMASLIKDKLTYFKSENLSDYIMQYASKFSWQTSINGYLKLYTEILNA